MTEFEITGVTPEGKRFKLVTYNWIQAFGVNLYRGTVWKVIETEDGKRKRKIVRRVWN